MTLIGSMVCQQAADAQVEMPATRFEAIAWLEEARNTVEKNDAGQVTKIIIDYVPDIFVVGDLDLFEHLEILEINYTGEFQDRHMTGIARLKSLKKFQVDYCEEISEASLSVLRYLPNLEEVVLHDCESVYSLKALGDCQTLKKIDISSNEHLDFHALKSLNLLPNLESLDLSSNSSLEDKHLRWVATIPGLKELNVSNCSELTDEAFIYLESLKELKVLNTSSNGKITGENFNLICGESLEELDVRNCSLTDASLEKLAHLKKLKKVRIDGNIEIKGKGLSVFQNFKQLQELWLEDFNVTNEQIRSLDGIKTLETVDLSSCGPCFWLGLAALRESSGLKNLNLAGCRRIDDEELEMICQFKNLEYLNLANTKVKPAGLKQLIELKKLEKLDLSQCNWVDDEAMKIVAALPTLKDLSLGRVPRLTDEGIENLAESKSLEKLKVSASRLITGVGFRAFQPESKLKTVVLSGIYKLSIAGLKSLAKMESLESLTIEAKKFSSRQFDALKGAPNLKSIDFNGDYEYEWLVELSDTLPSLDSED